MLGKTREYWLNTTYACGGIVTDEIGIIKETCPIYRWMIDKEIQKIKYFLRTKGQLIDCKELISMDKPKHYTPLWFSNMLPLEIPLIYNGIKYNTVEHFYQAMKTKNRNMQRKIASIQSPYAAKKYGQRIRIRDDWDNIKLKVMEYALRHKFQPGTVYYKMLIDTGDQEIIEWNYWNDTFWGKNIKTGEGENRLGLLLMKLRNEFMETKP